jgi:CBS domain-containing protein
MDEFKMTHLPVLNKHKFLGLISESDIYELDDWDNSIQQHHELLTPQSVSKGDHAFEAIRILGEFKISSLAVTDADGRYLGAISIAHTMNIISKLSLIEDVGGIVMLELNVVDYSMSEIAQIVESNGVQLLGSYVTANTDSKKMTVTLKLNKKDVSSVLQTFERYEYTVLGSFHITDSQDNVQDRFDNLMNYLNI